MIKINIISIGDIKETFYKKALKEYEKRISRFAAVTVLEIQEERLLGRTGCPCRAGR